MHIVFDPGISLVYRIVLICFLVLNIFLAAVIVFLDRDRRDATATWAWLLLLFVMPIFGFILYMFVGRALRMRRKKQVSGEAIEDALDRVDEQLENYKNDEFTTKNDIVSKHSDIVQMLLHDQMSFLTETNKVDLYTDGHDLYDQFKEDLRNAKDYIHLEYCKFEMDGLGTEVREILEQKAQEGLEVKVLYDSVGTKSVKKHTFDRLKELGGQVEAFFDSKIPLINFRINNRNHRKILVVDGKIGYVGGFNIGDDYLGLNEKMGYWRDTHLRVRGDGVDALQLSFIQDWNSQADREQLEFNKKYFPPNPHDDGDVAMQIALSAPDETWHQIEFGYMKLIMSAKESIRIHSPYFIPDRGFINALRIVAKAGVDVTIMIPCKPDHPLVYWATWDSVAQLIKDGIKVYTYDNGFLHSKTMVIDNEVASVGSASMDLRSFELNFEINAFVYNEKLARQLSEAFDNDIKKSTQLTEERYENRSNWIKFKEAIAKLISPLL
ncbi:cardiolipin synthase A/B [Staphylococcus auricularis]|uniref:cardiolipin synthase n=1 Tax=Staphylococcus auricularis TaxID=29379 RepID=UPI0019320287|nr:cardiolipin synthase [Staphylococcus auricularis]MBM0867139.1 cardiolipin synthase [Staphylococcus auricularis]MCG7340832.1 cardiolipin synthase [Staphylococcus auricularis]